MRWQMRNPAEVLERIQDMQQRRRRGLLKVDPFGSVWEKGALIMTRDESEQVEDLIMTWYRWTLGYRPHLDGPKVSPYCRGADAAAGDTNATAEERDDRLAVATAQQVEPCIMSLHWQLRAAIGIHAGNRAAGAAVYRNPRLSAEQAHQQYQQAKVELLPLLSRRGLVRKAA